MLYFVLVLLLLIGFIFTSEDMDSTVKTIMISSLFVLSIFAFCSFPEERQHVASRTLLEQGFRQLSDEEVYHSSKADLDKLTKIGSNYYVLDNNNK